MIGTEFGEVNHAVFQLISHFYVRSVGLFLLFVLGRFTRNDLLLLLSLTSSQNGLNQHFPDEYELFIQPIPEVAISKQTVSNIPMRRLLGVLACFRLIGV